ncbi:histidinol dehydrogenase, partial [Helicobacter pylori]|nr:histidinol dehydrogenase [Helicobacter pylori]
MRSVFFDASGILEAFDFRSVLIHKQEIQANQKVKLPFTEKNFFKFNSAVFGVCEGVGDLDYKDYPKNINFNALLVETIENYLLNANTENIKSEFKKLENQIIETTTRLLTSYQIFLNNAIDNANHQITENKTQSLEAITQAKNNANNEISNNQTKAIANINEAKNTANNEISNNKTQAINNINQAKESATTQINANKQEVLNHITQEKNQATSEITEAK